MTLDYERCMNHGITSVLCSMKMSNDNVNQLRDIEENSKLYGELGVSYATVYLQLFNSIVNITKTWDFDLIIEKMDKNYNIKTTDSDMLIPENFRSMVKRRNITEEEAKLKTFNLKQLVKETSYKKIKNSLSSIFIETDMVFNTKFNEELLHLENEESKLDKEKMSILSDITVGDMYGGQYEYSKEPSGLVVGCLKNKLEEFIQNQNKKEKSNNQQSQQSNVYSYNSNQYQGSSGVNQYPNLTNQQAQYPGQQVPLPQHPQPPQPTQNNRYSEQQVPLQNHPQSFQNNQYPYSQNPQSSTNLEKREIQQDTVSGKSNDRNKIKDYLEKLPKWSLLDNNDKEIMFQSVEYLEENVIVYRDNVRPCVCPTINCEFPNSKNRFVVPMAIKICPSCGVTYS